MDDLESRLEQELWGLGRAPLAEPEPVADLHRRARRARVGRALTGFVAVATAAVVVAGVLVATHRDPTAARSPKLRVASPSFVLGDIDAVVFSSGFDPDSARDSFPPALAAVVARVPGVQSVSGVVDSFAPIVAVNGAAVPTGGQTGIPPRTPILFSYHQADELHLVSGRLPAAPDEIVVDADFDARDPSAIGDTVSLDVHQPGLPQRDFRIVGTFELPGIDLTGIPLAALSAAHQPPELLLDRLDVKLAADANGADVRDAIAVAVGNQYTVAQPSVISFPDQRLAQLEIQHAYWALLSRDPTERGTAVAGPKDPNSNETYQQHLSETVNAELRVENVTFLSPDTATLTYRVFYGGSPSPIVNAPQPGAATRVDGVWKLTSATVCHLATADNLPCPSTADTDAVPRGWEPPATLDPAVARVFTALADPLATVDRRVAVVAPGTSVRSVVAAGVSADHRFTGKTMFTIIGWRSSGEATVDVLYTLVTNNGPSTPWPMFATAERGADGHWYAPPRDACGIAALTNRTCASTLGQPTRP